MSLSKTHITISGLGLMGGSLALALRGKCAGVTGVDTDEATLTFAREQGVVGFATGDFAEGVARADLLILATPVRTILAQLDQLAATPHSNSISNSRLSLLDLGSTKQLICAAMDSLPPHYDPIGGHPMCGKERSGIGSAEAGLFAGAAFVLSPLERTSPTAMTLAEEVVQAVGAHALLLDAREHDQLVAVTSHLPYLLAGSLMATAADAAARDERLWSLAASGFRDTTRLAGSDVRVMADILQTNREAVATAIAGYRAALDRLESALSSADADALPALLHEIRAARREHV